MKSSFAILMVNWNSHVDVANVLNNVPSNIPVVVVSNSSADLPELNQLLGASPLKTLIQSPMNGGYGAGMNLAINFAEANLECSSVLLLNPDVDVTQPFLEHVEGVSGKFDILGFQQFSTDSSGLRNYYPCAAYFNRGKIVVKPFEDSGVQQVDIVTGAAILLNLAALRGREFFDEKYFHYKEEFDLCFRMKSEGKTIAIDYDVPIHHRQGSSLPHGSPNAIYYQIRNEILFAKKHKQIPRMRSLFSVLAVIKHCSSLDTKSKTRTITLAIKDGLLGSSGMRKE